MSGELYDVLVLGPVEATPTAEARLAAALAGRNGAPLMAIAQALSEKSLIIGQSLDRVAAEALVRQLQALGALTSIRRASPAFPQSGELTPAGGPLPVLIPGAAPPSGVKPSLFGAAPGSGVRGLGQAPSSAGSLSRAPLSSPGAERAPGSGQGLRPLGSLRPDPPPPSTTPSAGSPRIPTDSLGHRVPTGAGFTFNEPPSSRARGSAKGMLQPEPPMPPEPAPGPPAGGDPFSTPDAGAPSLELDRGRRSGDSHRPAESVAGASGLFVPKMIASKSGSGLDLAGEKQTHIERCPNHGLLFDSSKSSACRKCLADAARATMGDRGGTLRANPARRALLGLLFALVLGFLPAAYYARSPGAAEVAQLRAEQQELSRGMGNEKAIQRFDEIEVLVQEKRRLSMRNTLIIWIVASGVMMVGWYRVT